MNLLLGINKIAFEIGDIPVAWYGIFVTLAIVLAFILYSFLAKKSGIDMDFSLEMFIWVVPIAVLFARLFYVIPREEYFPIESWSDFVMLFNITEGGITIIGAIVGGLLGVFLCCLRNKKYHMAQVTDCVVIGLLLGQIIGRWGNFFNQELYGKIIENPNLQWFPFAVFIDRTGHYHNALFFYEGVLNAIGLAVFLVLFFKCRDKIKPFGLTLLYIIWYGIVRSSLEYLKYEHHNFGDSNIGVIQTLCYIAAAIGIILFVLLQCGKIKFTTKWFDGLIEKRREKDTARQLAIETAIQNQTKTDGIAQDASDTNSDIDADKSDDIIQEANDIVAKEDSQSQQEVKVKNAELDNCDTDSTEQGDKTVQDKNFTQKTKEFFVKSASKTKEFFVGVGNKTKQACTKLKDKLSKKDKCDCDNTSEEQDNSTDDSSDNISQD